MLTVCARKRVPRPIGPSEIFSAKRIFGFVPGFVAFIGDEVEHFLRCSIDHDIAFNVDHVCAPFSVCPWRVVTGVGLRDGRWLVH